MLRLLRGLWSLAGLTVLLVGLPIGLVAIVGWPLPDHVPTADELRRWAAHPVTAPVLVNTAVCLVWLLWAWLLYAVVADVLTRLRRVVRWLGAARPPPLRVSTPMQATASSMVGAVVLGLSGGSNHPPAAGGIAEPATVATQPATTTGTRLAATDRTGQAGRAATPGEDRGADRGEHHPDWVGLPDGGWVPRQTAAAIAAAAGLVWIQRRRRYLPRRPVGVDRDDADLRPLPTTVAAVQAGVHPPADTADEAVHDDAAAIDAVAAPSLGQQAAAALRPTDLPAGGVGLTGVGTAHAARGILAATLLSGGPSDQDARLITTATDLHTLLGPRRPTASQDTAGHDIPGQAIAGEAIAGLYAAATLDQALAELDGVVLTRVRAMAAGRLGDPTAVPAHPTGAGLYPPIVVLVAAPPATHAERLAVMLALAAPLGIYGVLLGAWPHGPTWQVSADGTTHPAERPDAAGPRLCVLSVTAAIDLLTLLREAHPPRDRADPPAAAPPQPPRVQVRAGLGNPGHRVAAPRPRPAAPSATGVAGARPPAGPVGEPAVRLRVLGPPVVFRAGPHPQPVPIRRSAALQVLIFLAVQPQGATSSQLVKAIWPGTPPRSATASLYAAVKHLRSNLREATDARVIIHDGQGYRLDPAHIDVDLWGLRAAVAEAATALDPADRQRALRQVIDAYTGALAATAGWLWLGLHREAIRRHVIDAHTDLAAAHPDPPSALALLQDAIRVDPYNEELHRQAMRRYAAAGDRTAVRHLLDSITERLAAAGLQPQPATTGAGHEQAMRSATQPPTPPD